MKRPAVAGVLAVAALAVVLVAIDCARPASSEPLRVTYYYLPG